MKPKFIFPTVLLFLFISCRSSLFVQDGTGVADGDTRYLVSYYLPKTILKIKIPVEKAERKTGLIDKLNSKEKKELLDKIYEKYGWEALKSQDEVYSIGEKIHLVPLAIPDKNKHFTITYSGKKALANSSGIILTKDGLISSGEFAQEDKTFEYVTKGVELLASSASLLMGLGTPDSERKPLFEGSDLSKEQKRISNLLEELDNLTAVKADLLKNQTSAVSTVDPLKYRLELIDKRLLEIKHEILGYDKKTIYNISLLYDPGKTGIITLLEVDGKSGIRIPKMAGKDPQQNLLKDILVDKETKTFKSLNLIVSPIYEIGQPRKKFESSAKAGKHFLVYNIPTKYTIQITFDGKALKSFASSDDPKGLEQYEVYFPQKGSMAALPYDFKDMKVVFFDDIGAIKELRSSKEAILTAANVSSSFAAVDSILSFRNKIKESKKEEEPATEEVKEQVIRLIIEKEDSEQAD